MVDNNTECLVSFLVACGCHFRDRKRCLFRVQKHKQTKFNKKEKTKRKEEKNKKERN